jgi:NAD+ kinase
VKRVGILYHPQIEKAQNLANKLAGLLTAQEVSSWRCSAWDEDKARPQVAGTELILSLGGDGTILHAARIITPLSVPIVGINFGKLGFITELNGEEILANLPDLLEGNGWIEERAMLEAQLLPRHCERVSQSPEQSEGEAISHPALNDVVLRSTTVRLVNIEVEIDSEVITTYRADGIIIATATGSTAYSLAAGGPILHPQSKELVLQPVSCHLGLTHSLVLPPQSAVNLKVGGGDKAVLSLDGQVNLPLSGEQRVRVKRSPHTAHFLRIHQPTYFYGSLWQKLRGKVA